MEQVLYIASAGIEDPLIISQVVRYLEKLSRGGFRFHLLTLERKAIGNQDQIAADLRAKGIDWVPVDTSPRRFRFLRSIRRAKKIAKRLINEHPIKIIHSRSFLPGLVGLRARKRNIRFLYDMRGFWAEEKRAKGTIKYGWVQSILQRYENRLFRKADHLISLTHAGKDYLRKEGLETPITVIPCCAETGLFQPGPVESSTPFIVSVGSLGPGYLPEGIVAFFRELKKTMPEVRLRILSRSDREILEKVCQDEGVDINQIELLSSSPEEVPRYIGGALAGLCFIAPSFAKTASSPTKLAEYLACGIPVVGNNKIGDVEPIIRDNRVGVVVKSLDTQGYVDAANELKQVINSQNDLAERCRNVAVQKFSVDRGVELYQSVYESLLA